MTPKHVIDAHTLIWYLEDNPKLGANAGLIMEDRTSEMVLPMIALAEAVFIVESRRKTNLTSVEEVIADVTGDPRIELYPLTFEVLQLSTTLTQIPEIHDRLIVATAVYLQSLGHAVDILTKDSIITRINPIPIVW